MVSLYNAVKLTGRLDDDKDTVYLKTHRNDDTLFSKNTPDEILTVKRLKETYDLRHIFCGQEKEEIALLGQLKNDEEAPVRAVLDYDPCEKCLANWSTGVAMLWVSEDPPENGMPPLAVRDGKNLYPTGQYFVVRQDAAKRIFEVDVEKGMGVMMEAGAYDSFISDMKAQGLLDDKGDIVHEDH